jgi:hypothetical protein
MARLKIKRGAGKQWVEGKTFRLAEEVRYIQRRAALYDARIVTLGQLLLFSTETGDAWLLDPSDQLATPLARDGDALSVHIEETDTNFAIGWTGVYRIDGAAFLLRQRFRQRSHDPWLSDAENHPRNFKYVRLEFCFPSLRNPKSEFDSRRAHHPS